MNPLDTYIEMLYKKALRNFNDYVDMIYIEGISNISVDKTQRNPHSLNSTRKEVDKTITEQLLEDWLKKRGYTLNYILKRPVMIKGFTCVFVGKKHIEVWHDTKNHKSIFITDSYLTNIPITLNYMERI